MNINRVFQLSVRCCVAGVIVISIVMSIFGNNNWLLARSVESLPGQFDHTLFYEIDFANVPELTFTELTLKVTVGNISSAQVEVGGAIVPHEYDPTDGILQFNAHSSPVVIGLMGVADPSNIGKVEKATLKDDKKWAWSIGFDDNSGLEPTLAMLESYGYQGTIYQIARIIDDTRNKDWIIDRVDMLALIEKGWSMGNHTWDHSCYSTSDRTPTILDGYNRIAEIIRQSAKPNYKLISFAAPCFDARYHPYIINMRNSGTTDIQFNESGARFPLVVDPLSKANFSLNGRAVYAFDYDAPVPRDARAGFDPNAAIAEADWMAANASPTRHFWYNSLAHGNRKANVQLLVDHIYNTYGVAGTDEVWVAPADQIYSYILVRDRTVVTQKESDSISPPSTPTRPAPVYTATTPPTETPTATLFPTLTPTLSPTPTPKPSNMAIEVSHSSGVSGMQIGIFGSAFGAAKGNGAVEILGTAAQVLEWNDTFIKVTVPDVADGTGNLTVTGNNGSRVSAPFTVYTINPAFQQAPQQWFENVAYDLPAVISNMASASCYRQPENIFTRAEEFLFNYECGFAGVTNRGKATFNTNGGAAKVAVRIPDGLSGEYYLQYQTNSSWFIFNDVPSDYTIQVSTDSTNGSDGTWLTVNTITNNNRTTRLHHINVPTDKPYQWLRLNVSSGTGASGKFEMRELRLFRPKGNPNGPWNSFALYGDSLTASAFMAMGPSGLAAQVKQLRETSEDMIFTVYGLSGANSTGLVDSVSEVDIYDALRTDEMVQRATYWGIALGTNDAGDGASAIGIDGTNVEEFDNRLDAIVQELISQNRVPIIARIPQTIESNGGFGDTASKQKILNDIDTIAARYRLIPGPDFYTPFRRNAETQGGTYYGNDGTHHSTAGQQLLIELWAEALYSGTANIQEPPIEAPTPEQPTHTPTHTPTQRPRQRPRQHPHQRTRQRPYRLIQRLTHQRPSHCPHQHKSQLQHKSQPQRHCQLQHKSQLQRRCQPVHQICQ